MPHFDMSLRPSGGSLHRGLKPAALSAGLTALLRGAALTAVLAAALQGFTTGAQAQTQQPAPAPQGQAPAAPDQQFGDWMRRCTPNPPPQASPPPAGKQEVCFLIQQVSDRNTQNPILKITIGFFGPQRQAGAVIAMPLGVPLTQGLQLSVDGAEIRQVPFQVCRRDGCTAFVPLNEPAVSAFKAGAQAVARVDNGQGEGLNLPISLAGFTAGYGSIQ
ncbi:invasion associated locus B family protein [Pelagibius sp. 7325]|uniref:invasion associated locus B family protein n=1 Tax=Pelagibius sp. 7325 TaxID=3131994 RepID=UPI0030EF05E1